MPDAETVAQSAARFSRGWGPVPEAVWSPLAGSFLVLFPGLFSLAVGRPLLVASLGPTLYIQVAQPQHPTSRFYNVVLGHLVGFAPAAGAVLLLGAADAPSAFWAKHLTPARVWASVLAVAAALLVGVPLRVAFHPPAAATTLLVTLGGFRPTWSDFLTVAAGVLIVAGAGEVIRPGRSASATSRYGGIEETSIPTPLFQPLPCPYDDNRPECATAPAPSPPPTGPA